MVYCEVRATSNVNVSRISSAPPGHPGPEKFAKQSRPADLPPHTAKYHTRADREKVSSITPGHGSPDTHKIENTHRDVSLIRKYCDNRI